MTTTTPNLLLDLYNDTTDGSALFQNFRNSINGTSTNSAFNKIDTYAGNCSGSLTFLKNRYQPIYVAGSFISTGYYEATGVTYITTYGTNMQINLVLNVSTTGTTTININGLGTRTLVKINGAGSQVNLDSGDLKSGKNYLFRYDGAVFVLVGAITADQVSIAGTPGNLVMISGSGTLVDSGSVIAVSGSDVMSSTSGSVVKHNLSPISSGSYATIYVDKYGHVTGGSAPSTVGQLPTFDNGSIGADLVAWEKASALITDHTNRGNLFDKLIFSTMSLVYTTSNAYRGGVLDLNGSVHLVPSSAIRGQKIAMDGTVSTYSLVYTTSLAYAGGVLAPNGDIHFVPNRAARGQKISAAGVVSTYSLVYTNALGAYTGGVLDPNGNIHFVPGDGATVGQKVSSAGVVSTYSLVYTSQSYAGGVLAPNGDIHFVPGGATVGQKISPDGTVSTYSLAYTAGSFYGGVLAPNGDVHFVPSVPTVGQKVSIDGTVSTYSLVYTTTSSVYLGGVLAPNGDIHFIPTISSAPGQKVSSSGVVSTYTMPVTLSSQIGTGILIDDKIFYIPVSGTVLYTAYCQSAYPFEPAICCSPFFNKL